jgi:putative addiction module component (TIGR02574 family)
MSEEQQDFAITNEQRDELDRRLADYETRPDVGSSWGNVRARIEQKIERLS